MTTEEKARAYDEALKKMQPLYEQAKKDDNPIWSTYEHLFPELRESEDERIRKWLIDYFSLIKETLWIHRDFTCEQILGWLEKQKEHKELSPMDGNADLYFDEWNQQKQNPTKRQCFEEGMRYARRLQKEQKPDIELIQRTWYMEGYQDREHNLEPEWIVKTGEGGPRYEENPKYGQMLAEQEPAEKQDYSGLNDSERAIHRGFLCAGVENVPVRIIKETAKDCIAHFPWPTKWSKEDERIRQGLIEMYKNERLVPVPIGVHSKDIIRFLENLRPQSKEEWSEEEEGLISLTIAAVEDFYDKSNPIRSKIINLLKSPRPSWKPSDEQISSLKQARDYYMSGDIKYVGRHLSEIAEQLEKLM